jgi:hypothetical protein
VGTRDPITWDALDLSSVASFLLVAAASVGVYRAAVLVGAIWILTLFATLTIVLESSRAHSNHWSPISFPHCLYVNSSLTIEFARVSPRADSEPTLRSFVACYPSARSQFVGGQIASGRSGAHVGFNWLPEEPVSSFI